jgi:hypothetical protein
VAGTYHFTVPQAKPAMDEAATIVKTVAAVPQVSVDESNAALNLSGPADAVTFAEWILAQIDKAAPDNIPHEYRLPSGDIGRVNFVPNIQKPQGMQELLTVLRTVADVQKVFTFTPNQAMVLRGPAWEIDFAEWIIGQIDQPVQKNPDPTPREFTVGGPDYRGLGHAARINFLSTLKDPRQMQEVLTVLRTVGDVQKVFSFSSAHALALRAGDTDLERAEWLIQQMDQPAGQSSGPRIFTAPAGDDVTRIFYLRNTTPEWIQAAVTGMRSELNIKKIFDIRNPAYIVVRGTTDQIAAALAWMTLHNALPE